jgi:hypothetical protein
MLGVVDSARKRVEQQRRVSLAEFHDRMQVQKSQVETGSETGLNAAAKITGQSRETTTPVRYATKLEP